MRRLWIALLTVLLSACSQAPKDFAVTPEGIKSLSPSIAEVSITPQVDPSQVYVELRITKDPQTGGAQDWNSVAADTHYLATALFEKTAVARVRMAFKSPANNGLEWAVLFIRKTDLPQGWRGMTYLQFFSELDPLPGALDASRWLCEFYEKYPSSMPDGKRSRHCKA
jgi:hypothetical protein